MEQPALSDPIKNSQQMGDSGRILIVSILIVSAFFLYAFLFFKSTWAINDDVMMAMHASGKGFANEQTEYLIHSSIIIGNILKRLYKVAPSLPWYGLYTVSVLFAGFVALLYSVLARRFSMERIIYFVVFFVVLGLWFLRMPQFTTYAFILGMAGIFLFISTLRPDTGKAVSAAAGGAGILFLIIASLIRIESFFLVLILSVPLLLIEMSGVRNTRRLFLRTGILIVVMFSIVFSCYLYDRNSYLRDERWAYMLKKHKLIVEMLDNGMIAGYTAATKSAFYNSLWSANDIFLMGNGFFADERIFGFARLRALLTELQNLPARRTYEYLYFIRIFKDVYFYGALFLSALFIAATDKKRKSIIAIALSVLCALSVIFYLSYYSRLPDRVYVPIFSFIAFIPLYYSGVDMKSENAGKKIKSFFFVLLAISFLFVHYRSDIIKRGNTAFLKNYISRLHPTRDRIFVVWGKRLPFEYLTVFDNLKEFEEFRILTVGSFLNPGSAGILKEYNIKSFNELLGRDDVLHIGSGKYMALYSQYLKEHYNLDVAFKVYREHSVGESMMLYKCVMITPEIKSRLTPIAVNVGGLAYKVFVMSAT